jgi:hypothetical protein
MKIYKIAEEDLLPNSFKPIPGSCMLAAEIITEKLLSQGVENFKIVEGHITFPTVDWTETHTWIEKNDGEIIDPTKDQWGIKNISYLNQKRKEYSPLEYLNLCKKYPVEDKEKFFNSTYHEDL